MSLSTPWGHAGGRRGTAPLIHTLDTGLCVGEQSGSRPQPLKAGTNSTGDCVSCWAGLDVSANFNFEHYPEHVARITTLRKITSFYWYLIALALEVKQCCHVCISSLAVMAQTGKRKKKLSKLLASNQAGLCKPQCAEHRVRLCFPQRLD
jgi:hypothetical protein